MELEVDPLREGAILADGGTGIYVRAKRDGKWTSVDIVTLTRESLVKWLKSRGGDNEWAENTVCILLGHD